MKITILTLFPEMFESFLGNSIIKRAIAKGVVSIECKNIRDYTLDKYHRTDTPPIGGGAGLIEKCQPIVDAIGTWINVSAPPPAPPTVFALTSPSSGYFHVVPMASMVQQLQRDNYSAAVNKAYDRMVKELNGDKPYARLAVIEGPTGTGKTHVMTSLVAALNKQRCIYVPSTLVGDLDTPAFMRCMIDQKSASSGIVLLIEDGDLCLRDRVKFPEGVAKLTSMLNLTDGFLAKALDLRVIITTNLPYEDMDDAIKRDGRLFTHMKIDNLDADRALEVYRRLNKGATTEAFKPGETYPLSAVYAQSRK